MFSVRKSLNQILSHQNRASVSAIFVTKLPQIRFFAPSGPPAMFKQIIIGQKEMKHEQPSTTFVEQNILRNEPPKMVADQNIIMKEKSLKFDEDLKFQQDEFNTEEDKEKLKRQQRQWKGLKLGFTMLALATVSGLCYVIIYYGFAPTDPVTGLPIKDQYSDLKFPVLWRVFDFFTSWKTFIAEPSREKLLPDPVKPPWHQPKYTIVLEIRNVLVNPEWNYKKGHYFVKRPALDYFMNVVGYPNFELVIYTSENMNVAAPVVAQIDAKGHRVNHVLFRDCTKYKGGAHLKDLSRLNRDMSKVIYIDWDPTAFQLNPENVLRVPKWEGDMDDTFLVDLAELLKTIHLSDVNDVRQVLQFYSQYDNPMAEFRRRAQMLAQDSAQRKQGDASSISSTQSSQLKKYQGNLFGARRHAI